MFSPPQLSLHENSSRLCTASRAGGGGRGGPIAGTAAWMYGQCMGAGAAGTFALCASLLTHPLIALSVGRLGALRWSGEAKGRGCGEQGGERAPSAAPRAGPSGGPCAPTSPQAASPDCGGAWSGSDRLTCSRARRPPVRAAAAAVESSRRPAASRNAVCFAMGAVGSCRGSECAG